MSLHEHDLRLIEDYIVETISEDSLEEFTVKKATSKEFYDLLLMQDEVLHDITEDLYKTVLEEFGPLEDPDRAENDITLTFDKVGLALIVLSAVGIAAMSLILLTLNNLDGFF